jgi:hypothetical protein
MGGARKIAVSLVAAVCAAILLAACGGGDDSSTATTATTQSTTTPGNGGSQTQPEGGGGKGGREEGSPRRRGSKQGGGKKEEEPDTSGERSSSFRTPGGDNSIQEFGEEAGASERAAATKTITTFYSASANQEWAVICGLISSKNKAQLQLFSEKVPKLNGKGCTEVLQLVTPKNQPRPPETIDGQVISLRVEDDISFALYHGVDGKNYAFPLKEEEGEWKLTGLAPTPLTF